MELKINLDSLNQLISLESAKVVGKVLKRFEILDNKEVLKSEIKELLYESFRDFRDLLVALGRGLEPTVFKFKSQSQ